MAAHGAPVQPANGFAWQHHKDGSAIDGRGDYRSAKRLLRARWCARAASKGLRITTGRQWVRLRRSLRAVAKRVATC